jgi:hypothetical protein
MSQGELLISAFGIVVLMGNVVTAWAILTGKGQKRNIDQPFRVVAEDRVATESALAPLNHRVGVLENDVRMLRGKMEADKNEIIAAGEERMRKIGERVDTVLTAVSRVEGALEQMRHGK